jgi:hypothetical protein
MGALNAAHASANALMNASPDSRVGLIARYGQQAAVAAAAETAAADAQTALDGANDAVEATYTDYLAAQTALDPLNQATVDALTEAETAYNTALANAATAQTDYDTAAAAAVEAEALAVGYLEDAANKPVTPEVREAVDELLAGKIVAPEPTAVPDPTLEPDPTLTP